MIWLSRDNNITTSGIVRMWKGRPTLVGQQYTFEGGPIGNTSLSHSQQMIGRMIELGECVKVEAKEVRE